MDGKRPDTVDYDFTMPPSIATYFTNAYLVGAFWRNPNFSLNGSGTSPVGATDWALAVRALNKNFLVPVSYTHLDVYKRQYLHRQRPLGR